MHAHTHTHTHMHTHTHTHSDSLLAACWSKFIWMLISNKIWTFCSAVKRVGSVLSSQEVVFLQTPSLLASLYLYIIFLFSAVLKRTAIRDSTCASCNICETSCTFLCRCVIDRPGAWLFPGGKHLTAACQLCLLITTQSGEREVSALIS